MIRVQIVGQMAHPGSELSTRNWLNDTSAPSELLGLSLVRERSLMRLYRAADVLLKHQAATEANLFNEVQDPIRVEATISLYHLTNTSFEGTEAGNAMARRGHSKEKRSDCPFVTLGLVLDGESALAAAAGLPLLGGQPGSRAAVAGRFDHGDDGRRRDPQGPEGCR